MNTQIVADKLRSEVMRVAFNNKKGHISSSLSCLDILTVLYYKISEFNDRVILSKGHGCYGLYAIWMDKGIIDKSRWENFELSGCLEGFGSLGHGLPIAVGLAFGNKLLNKGGHVWCIAGDGEMQEGSMWEALSFMGHHQLKNITVIIDHNGLQAMDWIDNILSCNLYERLSGWGFSPELVDGHNHKKLEEVLSAKPRIVIADTIKGKGFKCMENIPKFHYRVPDDNERYNT
jgi:transketolase